MMIKTFTHKNFPVCDLETQNINGSRWYCLPNKKMVPSVTSVLSHFKSDSLQKWKERVGEEQSNKIKYKATARGTRIHEMVETYLNNSIVEESRPDLLQMFQDMIPVLNRIDDIYCQETVLYSDLVAGRTDVIASFDGIPSVIDFKTASKIKQESYITDYKEQVSIYAKMFEENEHICLKQAVIIIGVDNEPEPQIFILNHDEMKRHQIIFETKLIRFWEKQNVKS